MPLRLLSKTSVSVFAGLTLFNFYLFSLLRVDSVRMESFLLNGTGTSAFLLRFEIIKLRIEFESLGGGHTLEDLSWERIVGLMMIIICSMERQFFKRSLSSWNWRASLA